MKEIHANFSLLTALIIASASTLFAGNNDQPGRAPVMDSQGRFWVYRNGPAHPTMPFVPYGWMSDSTNNLTHLIQIDLDCRDKPHVGTATGGAPERECCIHMKFAWSNATWISVAFISGTDNPPWWGDAAGGTHFNLTDLPKKHLVFYGRGLHGGEAIKAQIGILNDKAFGDSTSKPIVSEEIQLGADWQRYEIDLKSVPTSELSAICNGFGVFAERSSQTGSPADTQFYIDDVYFE